MSFPKPLHQEVKEYLQDLLNREWIEKVTVTLCLTSGLCKKERWDIETAVITEN